MVCCGGSLHGFLEPSLPLKAQYLQNVALRLPGTKPHNNWLLLLRRLVFFSERLYIRNNLPFEIAFHSKWLRNNPKWPHGPIPSQGRRRRPWVPLAPLGTLGSPPLGSPWVPLGPLGLPLPPLGSPWFPWIPSPPRDLDQVGATKGRLKA